MIDWLNDACFYEIYPQSFMDTDNDGTGDLNGITDRLDYVAGLGCNAIWINPFYDSPFKDAGYDVRDYLKVAKRYGTNDDAVRLFETAHRKGIKILIDLVPGHTSEEHEWFRRSSEACPNEYSSRYIWTDHWIKGIGGHPYIGGESPRNGTYMLNFFKCQPALNYGWASPSEKWQSAIDSPEALATRDAMIDVMLFWLNLGCDGFRVDMADSLAKDDDSSKSATCLIWRYILSACRSKFPSAAFVSEWSCPVQSINGAGFDMDFYLDHDGNGYNRLVRSSNSYFNGECSFNEFLDDYIPALRDTSHNGLICMMTCNHDTVRPSHFLSDRALRLFYTFLLTMPGAPFIYYGDEIGMRYLDLPSKEGGYDRTGSRTPMQWDTSVIDAGIAGQLYLPCDDAADAPTVKEQERDVNSMLNFVRGLTALRHKNHDLQAYSDFRYIAGEDISHAVIYRRGDFYIAINPSQSQTSVSAPECRESHIIWSYGEGRVDSDRIVIDAASALILRQNREV